jgi:hypothetical protein
MLKDTNSPMVLGDMRQLTGRNVVYMTLGGIIGGLIGAGLGYLIYGGLWWLWGAVVAPITQPQFAFIYQGPPDPEPRLFWIAGGGLILGLFGIIVGYPNKNSKQSK